MENLKWKEKVDDKDNIWAEDVNAIADYANKLNGGKVDKEEGKGLSTNDFTNEYKSMLDNVVTDKADIIPTTENLVTTTAVYDFVEDAKKEVLKDIPVDNEFSETSTNPVQNKVVTNRINIHGQMLQRLLEEDDKIIKDAELVVVDREVEAIKTVWVYNEELDGLVPTTVTLKDTKAREMIANIPMQKIFETTTTEVVEEIVFDEDMDRNSFVLDEIYITITMPVTLTEKKEWGCYLNGGLTTPYCLFFFNASTSGTYYMAKSERMSNGFWDTLHFSNLSQQWSGSSLVLGRKMPSVDYINKVFISCPGLPIGSTVVVCGRKVVE